jgi:serine/threonine-protein kinase
MPYVEGAPLRDRLARLGRLPVGEAVGIARQVADALAYGHGRGMIHRDLKPENILLNGTQALLVDFGIARALNQATGDRLTGTLMVVGTPAYMSPEQAAGSGDIDQRTDIYALGCVLYEMLAGEPPLSGSIPDAVPGKRISTPASLVGPLVPDLPSRVEAACRRALARDPGHRFKTADQFARALSGD